MAARVHHGDGAGRVCVDGGEQQPSWLTVTSGASGSGGGPVGFSVAANATTSTRTGTLTIATRTFTVTQAAAPCTYSLQSGSQSIVGQRRQRGDDLPARACAGERRAPGWLTLTGATSGTGTGSVPYSVAANTGARVLAR